CLCRHVEGQQLVALLGVAVDSGVDVSEPGDRACAQAAEVEEVGTARGSGKRVGIGAASDRIEHAGAGEVQVVTPVGHKRLCEQLPGRIGDVGRSLQAVDVDRRAAIEVGIGGRIVAGNADDQVAV